MLTNLLLLSLLRILVMLLEYHDHLCCVLLQFNYTALHIAAMYGKNNILQHLNEQGARVDDVDTVS